MYQSTSGIPTASGAITIRTADGTSVGHGWGEVRMRRDPDTGRPSPVGEVKRMTWAKELPSLEARQSYRVDFHGGPSFAGAFDVGFPDVSQERATFRPSSIDGR
jgi:hypothetical protein